MMAVDGTLRYPRARGMSKSAASCWHLHILHRYGVARVVWWHVAMLFARSCLNHLILSEVWATLGITRIVYPGIIINTRGNRGSAIVNTHIAYIMQVRCSRVLIQPSATHVWCKYQTAVWRGFEARHVFYQCVRMRDKFVLFPHWCGYFLVFPNYLFCV